MSHLLTTEQIEEIVESSYHKEYFVWQMDEDNHGKSIEDFFNDEVFDNIDFKVIALMQHTGDYYYDCDKLIENDDYLVCDDDDADALAQKYAENYADDACREIPDYLQRYFDEDLYIQDLLEDRSSLLGHYDGCEYEESVNNTTYFIYRR